MKTIFVSATRSDSKEKTLLGKSFIEQKNCTSLTYELMMTFNNKESLPKIYNRFIAPEYKDCIVVFVHDDVSLNIAASIYELENALNEHDIVGLAGSTAAKIQKPALWHLMAPRQNLSGAVAHPITKDSKEIFMSSFGPYPQRCMLLDGVFLAAKINSLLTADVKFDEANPAIAHFYDLDFCLTANAKGLKMTTWPIYITHRSPGLLSLENPEWKTAQEWFINKWKNQPLSLF